MAARLDTVVNATLVAVMGAASGLAASALVAELRDTAGWVAPRLVRRAVKRLPVRLREIREEEWLNRIEEMDGLKLFRLVEACRMYFAAVVLGVRHRDERKREQRRGKPSTSKVLADGIAMYLVSAAAAKIDDDRTSEIRGEEWRGLAVDMDRAAIFRLIWAFCVWIRAGREYPTARR